MFVLKTSLDDKSASLSINRYFFGKEIYNVLSIKQFSLKIKVLKGSNIKAMSF